MRKEILEMMAVWDWGLFEAWKLLFKNWLLLQKPCFLNWKLGFNARCCDSNCKLVHSEEGQSYLITYRRPFPPIWFSCWLLQRKRNVARIAHVLCGILFYLCCSLEFLTSYSLYPLLLPVQIQNYSCPPQLLHSAGSCIKWEHLIWPPGIENFSLKKQMHKHWVWSRTEINSINTAGI